MRSCRAFILFVATSTLAAAGGGCSSLHDDTSSGPARVTVVNSLETVRFDQPTPVTGVSRAASLIAARNEFESFQIVVDAAGALSDVSVARGEVLRGPGGATIPAGNLTIYREVPYRVGTPGKPPSDSEGGPGLWPDALIPARDYFYGERRSAFPVDVQAGGRMVAWIDVLVPRGQPSGTYRGSVVVRDSSGLAAEVALTVRVLGFSIPSTTSLASAFGLDWRPVCEAHTGDDHCRGSLKMRWLLDSLYARAGLENRVTLSIPIPIDADKPPTSAVQQRLFDRFVVPMIRGRGGRLPGARLTSINISAHCLNAGNACLRGWRRLADRYRFVRRFSLYLCDEPRDEASVWRTCRGRAARAERGWAGARKLVTASIQDARRFGGHKRGDGSFLDQIDILVPIVNDVDGLEAGVFGDQRGRYDGYLRARQGGVHNSLWLYTSCASHGCGNTPVNSPLTLGWPGYAIDAPASQSRAMGWLAFEYRVSGELYYQTVSLLPSAWTDQFSFGGNGDGTLFYPGTPLGTGGGPAIGGVHDIPIESIRLKRIRDGREDYEYLRILAAQGRRAAAENVVRGLFGPPSVAMHQAAVDPTALEEARRKLAAMISGI